jgi:aryl-alcohol dehydrogenase-like predicted oxidoreductase
MMFAGSATSAGTARFASRFPSESAAGFYRTAQGLTVSTLGIGTYLGSMDAATDASYAQAIGRALQSGVNFIDTSLNYRNQRSERSIAGALSTWVHEAGGSRDEVVVCTKAGYLVPDAVPSGILGPQDIVGGMHCLAPAFLNDQIQRSRRNLGLETLDVVYLHNPETQLAHVAEENFYARIASAFELLEHLVETGDIRYYGAATWDGFRLGSGPRALSLARLVEAARTVAGDSHHCRFVQLPVNLAMMEALSKPLTEGRTVLELAGELGITVVASASLLQARLSRGLPDEVAAALPGATTDAQRAIQFTRSAPGVTIALVGMSNAEHVEENLGVARVQPLPADQFARAFA